MKDKTKRKVIDLFVQGNSINFITNYLSVTHSQVEEVIRNYLNKQSKDIIAERNYMTESY